MAWCQSSCTGLHLRWSEIRRLARFFVDILSGRHPACWSCCWLSSMTLPDSKWKLGQRWVLSCNFRWANVGCAMQNHPHFAHPKNVGPTCCTNVGPTCCTNVGPTCSRNVGPTCCRNVGPTCWANVCPTCWANVGSLLASGSC